MTDDRKFFAFCLIKAAESKFKKKPEVFEMCLHKYMIKHTKEMPFCKGSIPLKQRFGTISF